MFAQLVVPDFANGGLTLGSVILARAGDTAVSRGAFPIAPGFDRSFTPRDSERLYCEIAGGAPGAYRIRVRAESGDQRAEREIGFLVTAPGIRDR